jgi:hypothetical protein
VTLWCLTFNISFDNASEAATENSIPCVSNVRMCFVKQLENIVVHVALENDSFDLILWRIKVKTVSPNQKYANIVYVVLGTYLQEYRQFS